MTYEEKKRKIRKIATEVRKELQGIVPWLLNYYDSPRDIPKHLAGYCGYGSVMVHEALKEHGFKPKIARADGHWFVVCGSLLVDVTASQFSQPMVVVRNYKNVKNIIESNERCMRFWKADRLCSNVKTANVGVTQEEIDKARKKAKKHK